VTVVVMKKKKRQHPST